MAAMMTKQGPCLAPSLYTLERARIRHKSFGKTGQSPSQSATRKLDDPYKPNLIVLHNKQSSEDQINVEGRADHSAPFFNFFTQGRVLQPKYTSTIQNEGIEQLLKADAIARKLNRHQQKSNSKDPDDKFNDDGTSA